MFIMPENNRNQLPIGMIRDNLVNEIITALNKSNFSYFLIEYILKDLINYIHEQNLLQEKKEYEEYLKNQKESEQQNNNNK